MAHKAPDAREERRRAADCAGQGHPSDQGECLNSALPIIGLLIVYCKPQLSPNLNQIFCILLTYMRLAA